MSVRFHIRTLLIVVAIIAVLLTPAARALLAPFILLAWILIPFIVLMLVSTTALVDRGRRSGREINTTGKLSVRLCVVTLMAALTIFFLGLMALLLSD